MKKILAALALAIFASAKPQNTQGAQLFVDMNIEHRSFSLIEVKDQMLGVKVTLSRDYLSRSFSFSDDLKANGNPIAPQHTLYGIDIMGGGVNVRIAPLGSPQGGFYMLNGVIQEKDENGQKRIKNINIRFQGFPDRGFSIRQRGLELGISRQNEGYRIKGSVDPELYGKRDLAIVGAALAALTADVFYYR